MKNKNIALFMLLLFLVSGCGKKTPAEPLPVETIPVTIAPAETEPELEYATAAIDGIPAVLATLSRGDIVDVVNLCDEKHYVVKLDVGYGLVERNLVRLNGEVDYESWTGYAYRSAEVYDNYRLAGEPIQRLDAGAEVEVLDDLGWCVLVNQAGKAGYMKQECLSRNFNNVQDADNRTPGWNAGDGYTEDGREIYMQFAGEILLLSVIVPQEGKVSGKAVVLADETQIVLGYFDRGDKIPLLKQNTGSANLKVYLDGLYATVSGAYVQTEQESSYAVWDGQCKQVVSVYADYWMLGSPVDRLNAGSALRVLYELENCYMVEANGITGYVEKESVVSVQPDPVPETIPPDTTAATASKQDSAVKEPAKQQEDKPVPTETMESAEEEEPNEDANGNNSDGENSENASPEWTPPIL